MKFKKIEISAFRIYDKPEDATFDFSIDGDMIADFVSLYAPNGYGKTSFYDAVEWGMTNNIQRFWQNRVITNGAIDALKTQSEAQVKLWRNIHSKGPTYVKIWGEGIDPIDRTLKKPHGNKKSDADMDGAGSLVNPTFRHVILSQEWISAFLREIDGTKRYEIFMENPELKEVNSYYKNLKALLTVCQRKISDIDQRINVEQDRVRSLEDENVLEKINERISILTEKFHQLGLDKLTLATTKEEVSRLKSLIVDRLVSINDEVAIREKLEWVSAARVGNETQIGIRAYFDLETRNKIIEEAQRTARAILAKFSDFDRKTNEITSLNKSLAERETIQADMSKVISYYEEYRRVSGLLLGYENMSGALVKEINDRSDELSRLEMQETQTRAELNNTMASITQANKTIAELPEHFQLIKRIQQEITSQSAKATQEKDRLKPLGEQVKLIETELFVLENEVVDIKNGIYSKKFIEDQVLASSIDAIQVNREALNSNNELLLSISRQIEEQKTLNSELSEFIRQGLEIVNKDRSRNHCPLCEQAFKTHQELAERVANNSALEKIVQDLLANENKIEQEAARLRELIKNATGQLLLYFEEKIKDRRILHAALSDRIQTLTKAIASYDEGLEILNHDLRELMMQQLGVSNEAYEQDLVKNLEVLKKNEERLSAGLKEQTQNKKVIIDLVAKLREEQKLSTETVGALEQSEQYRAVLAWFRVNFNTDEISLDVLQNRLVENDRLIKEHFEKVSALRLELESLEREVGSFNEQTEKDRLNELVEEKGRAEAKMEGFRTLLKDKLQIDSQFIDFKTLSATLDLKEQGFNLTQINNKSLVDEYARMEKYADHINEFLQSENAKIELQRLAMDKAFLEDKVQSTLNGEIVKAKTFLQERVKEFFFENLINDLYRKIDPHPDFKEMYFSADFDVEPPRLDVFVRNEFNKKNDLIPNLYFSTAQINILSLSIFLATALNTSNYDCIFIDDPIQSMDSVNILSTIDLLRSLVLNYNKQIILSTHDVTFFNLLKKKMPMKSFKSKFLELESVGKVKMAL